MGKPLLAMKNDLSKINNSGTQNLSVRIPISELVYTETFEKLFPLNEKMVKTITDSIIKDRYDDSQPIHVWVKPDTNELILIDGFTRTAASKAAGLYDIPAFKHYFETEAEALIYALHLQLDRRQLSDGEKIIAIEKLNNLKNPGKKSQDSTEQTGKSAATIAEQLGMSTSQVEKNRFILNNGTQEEIDSVKNGEKSTNQVAKEIKTRKKQKKETTEKESSSGTPSALPSFDHSDHIERPDPKTSDDTVFVTLEEKNLQIESARKEEFSRGLETGFYYVLGEWKKGKSREEIFNSINDFSPSVIWNFKLPEDDEFGGFNETSF